MTHSEEFHENGYSIVNGIISNELTIEAQFIKRLVLSNYPIKK